MQSRNRSWRSVAAVLVVVLWQLLFLRDARAEDVSKAAYDDIKAVFEELMVRDVANNLARNLELQAPALRFYYRASLERLRARAWGSLGTTLKSDSAELIADFVLWSMRHPSATEASPGEAVLRLRTFLSCFREASQWEGKDAAASCKDEALKTIREDLERPGVDLAGVATMTERCVNDARKSFKPLAECDVAAAIRSAIGGRLEQARSYAVSVAASVVVGRVSAKLAAFGPKWIENHADIYGPLSDALRRDVEQWVEGARGEGRATIDFARALDRLRPIGCAATKQDWVTWLAGSIDEDTIRCEAFSSQEGIPSLAKIRVQFTPKGAGAAPLYRDLAILGEADTDSKPRSLLSRVACQDAEGDLCTADREMKCDKDIVVGIGGKNFTLRGPGECAAASMLLQTILQNFQRGRVVTDEQRKLVDEFFGRPFEKLNGAERAAILDELRTAYAVFLKMRSQWYLWSSRRDSMDLLGLIEAVLEIGSKTPPDCADNGSGSATACNSVTRVRVALAESNTELRRIAAAAFRGDHRELAVRALSTALEMTGTVTVAKPASDASKATDASEEGRVCPSKKDSYGRLIVSFASYVLDDSGSTSEKQSSENVSRTAFRAAAVDALQCLQGGGVDRDAREGRFRNGIIALDPFPSPGLRLSWNQGYVNQTSQDAFRYTATLDWPTVRVRLTERSALYYGAVQISFFDALAPLAELAVRNRDARFEPNDGAMWLDAVRPRIDGLAGFPGLTSHVLLAAGVSFRASFPERIDSRSGDVPAPGEPALRRYKYRTFWNAVDMTSMIELNVGIKYVF